MSRRRDRLEVIHDLLMVIQNNGGSIKKTPLLRKTNLSSQSFVDYFDELLGKGFIIEVDSGKKGKFVTLTDKGHRYISKYNQFQGFISEFGL